MILNKMSWLLYVKICLLKEPMLRLSHYLISLILEPISNKCSITLLLSYFNLLRIGIKEESYSKLVFLKEYAGRSSLFTSLNFGLKTWVCVTLAEVNERR